MFIFDSAMYVYKYCACVFIYVYCLSPSSVYMQLPILQSPLSHLDSAGSHLHTTILLTLCKPQLVKQNLYYYTHQLQDTHLPAPQFAPHLCSQSCLYLLQPHTGPVRVLLHLLAHHKQKYNLQVGIVQCKSYVCNTFHDAACVLPLVCVGIVGNDGELFTHQHSQCDILWSCVLFWP